MRHFLTVVVTAFAVGVSPPQTLPPADAQPTGGDPSIEFHFARVHFSSGGFGRRSGWAHDYPRADSNFLTILAEVTRIKTTSESYVVVKLEDPAIMQYPLLYFSEPGTWAITPEEAANFREYLMRGGFAVFDDFDGAYQWNNFESCMKEVLPEFKLEVLTLDHTVFQCFFQIKTLDMVPPYAVAEKPIFYGITDDKGRLLVVANFNNDIGDYWEWSGNLFYPIDQSNEGYKFGVNYVVYAMTR